MLFSALLVSVLGHTTYYGLIQRYEANLIAPLTLMSPLMTIALGIWITGDHFDARMAFGTALALVGVFIIAIRPNAHARAPSRSRMRRSRASSGARTTARRISCG